MLTCPSLHYLLLNKFSKSIFCCPKTIFSILILVAVGCTPQLFWAKPGAQPGDFEEDTEQCHALLLASQNQQEGSQFPAFPFKIGNKAMEQCLMDKGWILAEKP